MIETTENKLLFKIGSEKTFPFNIRFFEPGDIHCYVNSDGKEWELDQTEFSVEKKEDYSNGALITILNDFPADATLAITREMPITQGVSFPLQGKFPSKSNEQALDKLTMLCQQINEEVGRAIKSPVVGDEPEAENLVKFIQDNADRSRENAEDAEDSAKTASEAANTATAAADTASEAADTATSAADTASEAAASILGKTAGVPMGTIFPFPANTPPPGAFILDGQTIVGCSTVFPAFYEWVQTSGVRLIDNSTFGSELYSTGVCGGFVLDTENGNVRLPSLINGTVWGADGESIGQSLAAGLPNITGELTYLTADAANISSTNYPTTGAFRWANENYSSRVATKAESGSRDVSFDASRSNPIYGNSSTVQPPAVRWSWCIQVYNDAVTLSMAQTGEIINKLTGYLPLAGGTVTGRIDRSVVGDVNCEVVGAKNEKSGHEIWFGIGEANHNRGIWDKATNSWLINLNEQNELHSLGKKVELVDSIGSNYIRYGNGLQMCWGRVGAAAYTNYTVTFPHPFSVAPNMVVSGGNIGVDTISVNTSTTSADVHVAAYNGTNPVQWIAIGKWK